MREPVVIPPALDALRHEPGGTEWLQRLPDIVGESIERWQLSVGSPYPGSTVSWVAPVDGTDHGPAVLKVQWPHPECEHEAAALRSWNGNGAVELLDHAPELHTLLLERCTPGHHLGGVLGVDPLTVVVDLLPRLWVEPDPAITSLGDEAAGWRSRLVSSWEQTGRPCERRLVDAALSAADDLLGSTTDDDAVVLHQDLHGHNILSSGRSPWLVIDPKPLAGDRAFSVAPLVRSVELGHSRAAVELRLERLCSELGLDVDRARAWTVLQTMAWSWGTPHRARHHETARWLLET